MKAALSASSGSFLQEKAAASVASEYAPQEQLHTSFIKSRGTKFSIPANYRLLRKVGQGAYGLILAAEDMQTGAHVAIKKVSNACASSPLEMKRMLREVLLLQHFNHENILRIHDLHFEAPSPSALHGVYLVTELMDTDLHYIIHSKQPLTDDHIQYFVYQILRGLKAIHSAGVMHRDIKPSNLLVNQNCDLKICDFGLARGVAQPWQPETPMLSEYVVTRWYRAPELLLLSESYSTAIDMWSVGCVLAELLLRRPVFPGRDPLQQLRLITQLVSAGGSRDEVLLGWIQNPKAAGYIRNLLPEPPPRLEDSFPGAKSSCIDLLDHMLVLDPSQRVSAADALAHKYLAPLHAINAEPSATLIDLSLMEKQMSEAEHLQLLREQHLRFHPFDPSATSPTRYCSRAASEPETPAARRSKACRDQPSIGSTSGRASLIHSQPQARGCRKRFAETGCSPRPTTRERRCLEVLGGASGAWCSPPFESVRGGAVATEDLIARCAASNACSGAVGRQWEVFRWDGETMTLTLSPRPRRRLSIRFRDREAGVRVLRMFVSRLVQRGELLFKTAYEMSKEDAEVTRPPGVLSLRNVGKGEDRVSFVFEGEEFRRA